MNQLNFHNNSFKQAPPQRKINDFPILYQLTESYKLWHSFFTRLPKTERYLLGAKIENCFCECLELSLAAGYAKREEKILIVRRLNLKFDYLKFFLKLLWELKALDNNKYAAISTDLSTIGKMIGGWLKTLG